MILFIVISASLLSLTPLGESLEEEYGLAWLFKLRGEMLPPKEVIIISIDKKSAQVLQLPEDPEEWPRSYYAKLIDRLNEQSPAIIAINITFNKSKDAKNDRLLAAAISKNHNVILSNYLKRYSGLESRIDPIPILNKASLSASPFLLPKSATTVKYFWAYTNSDKNSITFPTDIFKHFIFKKSYLDIFQLLKQLNLEWYSSNLSHFEQHLHPLDLTNIEQKIASIFFNHPPEIEKFKQLLKKANVSAEKEHRLLSWLTLLKKPNILYFNHYGTTGKIPTIPLYQALESDILNPNLFHNKVILIGYSEDIEPEKNQGFYTVFSDMTISPIEIAATAVANLIDNSWLKPMLPGYNFLLILVWGGLLCSIYYFLPYRVAIISITVLGLGFITIANLLFTVDHIWLPIFIPIAIQTPLILLILSLSCFFKTRKEHKEIHNTFGQYLPYDALNELIETPSLDKVGGVMFGVCLATDIKSYTTLSEAMDPQELHTLMNSYYKTIFAPVKENKGFISDIIGDAMLAIWAKPSENTQTRSDACYAALSIKKVLDNFNRSQPYQLPTRLGLHYGKFRLGNIGAPGHYEYRAVGDTVNTATRIETLNKLLGTQLLVSSDIIHHLPGFYSREMGYFLLKGKNTPIRIYELTASINQKNTTPDKLISTFSTALKLFQNCQWEEALEQWLSIQNKFPDDGPTLFYINYLTQISTPFSSHHHHSQPAIINTGNITFLLEG